MACSDSDILVATDQVRTEPVVRHTLHTVSYVMKSLQQYFMINGVKLSNAAERSSNARYARSPSSNASRMSDSTLATAVSVK